jgi:3',5'-cyclic AMP phosphodiesterase CpdA
VYWTLRHHWLTIVGLYSNVPDGGRIAEGQVEWLVRELREARRDAVLILALHHCLYSTDLVHGSNLALADLLDGAFARAGRAPDAVLSGHVHSYQRFARAGPGWAEATYSTVAEGVASPFDSFSITASSKRRPERQR